MRSAPSNIDELRAGLARELEIDVRRLTRDTRFVGDIGISSINAIVVIMALEEWFGLRISDEEAENVCSLNDAQRLLESRGIALEGGSA
jgi:acyl carrier protein